ncbi:hypothetical protein AB9L18_10395 [Stenotrophomonas lactitubi]|uniref:hypothetical protein n=1 Tax=Stenotrophomonas lactitubi TaxID=2045214 RepID=UPI0035C0F4B5
MNEKISNIGKKAAAVAAAALVTGPAFAGDLATAATSGMDGGELTLIGVAVLTLCGIVALIKKGQRASGG